MEPIDIFEMEISIYTGNKRNGEKDWTRTMGTPVSVHYPRLAETSRWYFYAEGFQRIFLRTGWNTFGRNTRNTFEIHSNLFRQREFSIYISPISSRYPVFNSFHYARINGHEITHRDGPQELKSQNTISVVGGNIVIIFILRYAINRS